MRVPNIDRSSKKGFTLVELIVVLVILAILAAILIPSMIGWIEKANQSSAVVEARTCLQAAQTIAVERYSAKKSYAPDTNAEDEAETLELAQLKGDIQDITVTTDTATVTKLVYKASNGTVVTYENGEYTFGDVSSASDMSDSAILKKVYSTLQSVIGNPDNKLYSSNSANSDAIKAALNNAGIDLDAMGATNWTIRYSKDYPKLYWTTESLDGKKTVTVMAYTFSSGNYTVWNANVTTTVNGVNTIGIEKNMVTTVDQKQQTYEQMMADYAAATKS